MRWLFPIALVLVAGGMPDRSLALEHPSGAQPTFQTILDVESAARLLAILLDSGRNVIDENQALIDDVENGDKGLTPESFEIRLNEVFGLRSGIDLGNLDSSHLSNRTKNLLQGLVSVSKQVVKEAQATINRKGVGFKGFIPAVFGSLVAMRYSDSTGVLLGQRALVPRNPSNLPDPFERTALLEFADPLYPREKVITEVTSDSRWLRLMLPLYATRGCLDCHGEPKGDIDKTGYPREGLQFGQIAGGISVMLPLEE